MPLSLQLTPSKLVVALTFIAGCASPATQVLLVVDTDVPATLPFTLRARVMRGHEGGRRVTLQEWLRAPQGTNAGERFPASFTVIPGDGPRDGLVRVELEGESQGSVIRRTVNLQFVPRLRGATVRVFLSSRCVAPAMGCRTAGVSCTVQQLCEELGRTCGNDGACVVPETELEVNTADAGFDVRSIDTGVAVDASGPCGAYGQRCCPGASPCEGPLSCANGTCRRCTDSAEVCCNGADWLPNNTTCAMTMDPCKRAGTCTDGVCSPVANAPDGTDCGAGPDTCRPRRACVAGACTGFINAMNGTQCAAQNLAACEAARTCNNGACAPAARIAANTVCRPSGNSCELDARCGASGACPANPNRPDNFRPSATTHCCNGAEVSRASTRHCNVCNLGCSGACGSHNIGGTTQWFCTCTTTASCGGTRVCRTQTPNANTCSCDTMNSNCPAGTHCQMESFNPDPCVPN